MLVPFLFASVVLFGSLAVVFSFLWEKNRKRLFETQKELGRQLYELNILHEVNDKIGYSLKTQDIARTIAVTAERLFPLKTASYAVVSDGEIIFESFIKDHVSDGYMKEVKSIIQTALFTLDDTLEHFKISEYPAVMIGEKIPLRNKDTSFDVVPNSYFNIPLVLNNKFVGIISITSPEKRIYQDKDMSLLYKIVNQTQLAIGRLENVIDTEKGKIQSLIYSLSSGAILFMMEQGQLKLITINNAARSYLRLSGPIDTDIVFSQFQYEGNFVLEVRTVMKERKLKVLRGIELFGKQFNLSINPVFDNATLRVIGVAITMQDVTLEYESERLRENFTNMIVHELRAPLTSIKGGIELLSSGEMSSGNRKKMMDTIQSSSERMLNDINQLLDAARIQSGKFETEPKPSDIIKLIEDRVKMFQILAEKRHITIDFEKDGDVPIFHFDPLRIEQIFNNLLSNAIKYNHENGRVLIRIFTDKKNIHIVVSDTGIGIPKSLQKELFTKFYQTSIQHRGSGTGLGLFITKAVVDAHGGVISLESQEGQGTTIEFTLPLVGVENSSEPVVSREGIYLN